MLVPFAIEELMALIVIDCRVAAVTVSGKILDVIPFWAAVILLEPAPAPVAKPLALTFAAARLEEAHVAVFVTFCVVPSLNVPTAVNCRLVPLAMEELLAVIATDCNVAALTERAKAFEEIPP